jgi:hypothetical protein
VERDFFMNNDKRLDELRAQRELIRKHLEWLDARISEQEGKEELQPGEPHSIVATEADDDSQSDSKLKAVDGNSDSPGTTEEHTDITAPIEDLEKDEGFPAYKGATGDDLLRAKIGCLVLFVLSTVLFLFLLFGLPYLLD